MQSMTIDRTTEVYIICRVFNLGKDNTGMRLYVHPYLRERQGELIFEPSSYIVTPLGIERQEQRSSISEPHEQEASSSQRQAQEAPYLERHEQEGSSIRIPEPEPLTNSTQEEDDEEL